jgi:SAM-dependent methyltransferase
MLLNGGYDAWMADPYVPTPFFAPERMIPDLADVPAGSFDAVTAFEVLEHLPDPLPTLRDLRRVLKPDGVMVVSTEIYRPGVHGPDWHYLSCEAGQHVMFWTREGFRRLAAKLGFASVGYFPDSKGFCTILSARPADELARLLGRAAAGLTRPAFLDEATRGWELTRMGALPAPAALADAAAEGGEPCAS